MEGSGMKHAKSALWFTIGSTIYLLCQWLLSFLVVRLSGYEDAGALSLAMSISNVFFIFATFSMRTHQVADIEDDTPSGVYVTSRVFTTGLAYGCVIIFGFANHYRPRTLSVLLLYCLFRATEAAADVLHGIDQKKGRLDAAGKSGALRGAAFLAAFVLTLRLGGSLAAACLTMFVAAALVVALYDVPIAYSLSPFRLCFDRKRTTELLFICAPLMLGSLCNTVMGTIPRYVLERLQGSEALGYFASVATPVLIVQVASSYLYAPLVPSFAELARRGDRKGFSRLVRRVCILIACLSAAALAGGAVLGEYALSVLFGNAIRPYAYLLLPAVVCTVLTAFTWFIATLLTVLGDRKGILFASAAALLATMAGAVPLIRQFELQGANYCNLLGLSVYLALLLLRYAHEMKSL